MADLLRLDRVSAGYGATVVLDDVSLRLADGETVAVLGRNGVGKTTLLGSVMGHTTLHSGEIRFEDVRIERWPIWRRARLGIGLVPQERAIFPSLSVQENLGIALRGRRWTIPHVYDLFPRLAERRRSRGNQLSGGEQQMLAVGRALLGEPTLLLLDEPLEGLAPQIADALLSVLARLRDDAGLTMLLVEQHALLALDFAPRVIVLDRGRPVYDGPSRALKENPQQLTTFIGVSAGEASRAQGSMARLENAHPPTRGG
jgi:branched-chain amino acid transport system ATP-binding protein